MDIDEDDDFYAPDEPEVPAAQPAPAAAPATSKPDAGDELEEGEEEDEGGEMDEDEDSDIDIIVENKDPSKPTPPSQSRYSEIRNIPQRSAATDTTVKAAPVKKEDRQPALQHPAISTSKVEVNAIPIHKPTGKPLTQVNIDEDLTDNDKPWRKPGTDLSDYFNYGFDEFTWALYAQKQEALRGEYSQEAVAQSSKKMMEEMTNMMMMGGMLPGMGGAGGAGAGGAAAAPIPGMEGIPPEMQAMMQQLMANGMDPSQMDVGAMYAGMQNAAGAGGASGQGGQGQNFGAGFGGNQGQGYGYDQQMGGTGGPGGGGGGRGGRGRGRRGPKKAGADDQSANLYGRVKLCASITKIPKTTAEKLAQQTILLLVLQPMMSERECFLERRPKTQQHLYVDNLIPKVYARRPTGTQAAAAA
ncbi:hypothetical protein OQA88_9566 [Cercophora sp. LCS_1]